MSFITPYPKRGEMDEWKPGMDDEATSDKDGVPHLPDADDGSTEDDDDQDIADIDPEDWVDPHWAEHHGSGAGEDRGSGQGDQSGGGGGEHRGSGGAPATGWTDDIDDQVFVHASHLRHLQNIQAIAKTDIRWPIGEQLSQVVANVAKDIEKKFRAKVNGEPRGASRVECESCGRYWVLQ